jgi:hypothetical protein
MSATDRASEKELANQQELLAIYRHTVMHLLKQAAQYAFPNTGLIKRIQVSTCYVPRIPRLRNPH